MKILLTGASGMVGRNIQDHPLASEHAWLTPSSAALNLLDYATVKQYFETHRPDAVIHAAGRVGGIQANMREPVRFLVDNLDMGRNVLMAAAETGVARLINFGSTCMYPKDQQGALAEGDVLTGMLEPTNEGYALAKITVARLADYLCRENPQLQYKTVIPCNLYGPYDKFDPRWSHMIPAVIHKLHEAKQQGLDSVEIWGSGQARREFLYAGDLADAVMRALTNFESLPSLMNIGLGHDYTVNQYYEIAAKVVGYQGGFHHDLSKPTGMQRKLSDTRRAMEWGWQPGHTLEQGLAKTYQYYLNQL
ncbi:GDP-L-fucose synthase family protein [Comamonas testosteroni]|uniref:GDP-L-fucose synthase n=1 Tax=Comamonas testosteroni TaxID=285 RepID=A0A096FJR9_COMTE|nr:GDP-L-fucose synthase [Comamonas testosteroni]KGH30596.1 nodulation protein NolK [Comamonas testosteroni]